MSNRDRSNLSRRDMLKTAGLSLALPLCMPGGARGKPRGSGAKDQLRIGISDTDSR